MYAGEWGGFPRHFAGASLKPFRNTLPTATWETFSPAFRWGLIEARSGPLRTRHPAPFSPAFRWGLIEATSEERPIYGPSRFPRHFAGASLKLLGIHGSLECESRFPRHFAGASLKRPRVGGALPQQLPVFPGISLGPHCSSARTPRAAAASSFSPAFRWGLIEAAPGRAAASAGWAFSPAFRWGLIEARRRLRIDPRRGRVFPGISLGPH